MSRARDLADSADLNFDSGTLVIDSANNRIGVGTTSPSAVLETKNTTDGSTLAFQATNDNNHEIVRIGAQADGDGYLTVHGQGASTNVKVQLHSDDVSYFTGGNVGIGTSSPATKIHAVASAAVPATFERDGSGTIATFYRNTVTGNQGALIGADSVAGYFAGGNNTRNMLYIDSANEQMQFFTANTERMRLDASGNLLVGKTTTATGTVGGVWHSSTGVLQTTADGATVLYLNRETSDGNIVEFRKDNTTVGSIGTTGGRIGIGTGDCGVYYNETLDAIIPANPSTTFTNRDAAIDFGVSGVRFKNLYLSGGVYLGGTGAANYLDDYEEGTWTPVLQGSTSGSATYTVNSGAYVKIGRFVHCVGAFNLSSVSGMVGSVFIEGLPFAIADVLSGTSNDAVGTITNFNALGINVSSIVVQAVQVSNVFEIRYWPAAGGGGTTVLDSSDLATGSFRFDLRYYTTA